ncbi:DUF2147 domain-containing protein [Noviherbaspirillum cavernae]|uniref:DUF2147 domain-containing protein n=1 Tax=Noviherbaspirillum cavernae TaxID=2320862 RepID=A0A418X3W4_9BURK|nr:DUF2147 domain-containing protein [Noviherbaspirillum cavernae]RJG07157.1 DUF2147 domain-containing protein [Noviherbaspirillum cavernae]
MIKKFLTSAIAASALLALGAWAQQASPVGLWKNIDDETGKPKALIRITESNGEFKGRIEKLFRDANEDQNPKCDKCEGTRKDQPIIGMTILTGLKQEGSEYTGGQLLDPGNGKVYKSKAALVDGGRKLDVRGYIGAPLFGRSQTWVRAE